MGLDSIYKEDFMFGFLKRHKIVIIVVLIDLLLYWIIFCTDVVLPFINPSVEEYKHMVATGTTFPRNTTQIVFWVFMHAPTSAITSIITRSDNFLFLSVVQTGVITFYIEKFIRRRRDKNLTTLH